MITCAMCDDELPFAEQLRSFVMAYAKKRRVELQAETFASAEELLEEIENGAGFEILFLDIEMRKMDGIELGKSFVSAHTRHLLYMFQVMTSICDSCLRQSHFVFCQNH